MTTTTTNAFVKSAMLRRDFNVEQRAIRLVNATARGPILVAVVGLFVLGVLYTLHFAAALLLPMAFAVLLAFLLAPVVRKAGTVGIPRVFVAGFLVGSIVVGVSVGAYSLSEPAAAWLRAAPTNIDEVREKFVGLGTPLADVREAAQAVEEAVQGIAGEVEGEPEQVVQLRQEGWLDPVIRRVPYLAGAFAIAMVLTIFLLAWGDELTSGFAAMRRGFGVRRRTLATICHMQRDVARYLVTVTTINLLLGIAVWLAMLWVGMPNAPLWGTLAGVANFAPYVGPACTAGALLLAGANAFDAWQAAITPSLVFCAITALEGQMITPAILGHRLLVPPPVIFIAVLSFGWLWGIAGALIAVPIVIVVKRLWLRDDANLRKCSTRKPGGDCLPARLGSRGNVITLTPE
jgi:predicted PurR-regulated permease PerM